MSSRFSHSSGRAAKLLPHNRSSRVPPFPREHGAWGILIGSFFSAVAVVGAITGPMILLLLASASLYLAHPIVLLTVRKKGDRSDRIWGMCFITLGACFLFLASMSYRPIIAWSLVLPGFVLAEIILIRLRKQQSLLAHMTGMIGLAAVAPLTVILYECGVSTSAGALWAAGCAFFASGILMARYHIARMRAKSLADRVQRRDRGVLIGYHLFLAAGLLCLGLSAPSHARFIIIFLPTLVLSLLVAADRLANISLRRIGWLIVAQTILFILLLALIT
ncbi:MAG: hypothetical protein GTO51_06265 [Candidatus Latescibacteria bacterium]|nr:hypothetical protein [Candidatus Latescibacterota bacterium]NIM21395.1 hypothetical protein [Candidatus Latescibacterota bacterium]NIM65576.1 hypothetical protein [Candidatus Latescibacterota bacterium]NIO01956.1 hypothetical protein [Candidatus Latescibacterota bacterium]NIO28769.1 hypothetical protein [Candidatus Latescibacterota bacterium]